ncbi:MAG TPA: hypothetical protein ACQGQH_09840 [Xylella sp.]
MAHRLRYFVLEGCTIDRWGLGQHADHTAWLILSIQICSQFATQTTLSRNEP